MIFVCPECRSRDVREARRRGFFERLGFLLGYLPVRCRGCGHRHHRSTLILREFYYAHCPQCLSQRLTDWEEKYNFPGGWAHVWLLLGARQDRCDPCRHNFVSFRPRKRLGKPSLPAITPRGSATNGQNAKRETNAAKTAGS